MFIIKNAGYIIGAGTLWGIISLFVNALKELGFNSIQCVAIRVFFAACIMVIYLLIKDKSLLRIQLKDIKYFIGTGVFSIVLFNYCYFEAIEVIGGASVPALLLYMAPIFVMILSFFLFEEKITKQKVAALIMTFIGLGFVTGAFTGSETLSVSALFLGLGSGFGYALYSIFGKMVVEKYNALTITAYTFIVAAVVVVPFSGVIPRISLVINIKGIGAVFGLSFFSTVLAFLLYTKGLTKIEAGKASILATIEPFVAAIVGAVFYQERFTASKIVGMLFIVAAIILLNLPKRRKEAIAYEDEIQH